MRSLSRAEIRVIRVLLADLPGTERQRFRAAEVPRTTYQTVRGRAFANGWLKERYIPHPSLVGRDRVRLILAQPYAEHWNQSIRAFRSTDGLVLLWASPETLFGVVFERSSTRAWEPPIAPESFRRYWTVAPEGEGGGLPAYFDYEGVWSSWTLGSPPLAYPRQVARASSSAPAKTREDRVAVRSLLMRPFESIPGRSGIIAQSPARLSRHERRLIADGRVSHRVLPDFHQIPSVRGFRPERLAYVTGETRPDRNPAELFGDLLHRAHVAPFLYAYDKERVLVSALSPAPPGNVERHLPVLSVVQEYLQRIEVVREPIDAMFPLIDHRYDQLTVPAI